MDYSEVRQIIKDRLEIDVTVNSPASDVVSVKIQVRWREENGGITIISETEDTSVVNWD